MMPGRKWLRKVLWLVIEFACCGMLIGNMGGCREQISSSPALPQPPDESLRVTFVYPDEPVLLNEEAYRRTLSEMAEQITLVAVQAPKHQFSAEDLHLLREIQQRYYRYGLLVLLLDLNDPASWPELKRSLSLARANYPAAYLSGCLRVNSVLKITNIRDNELWIVNPSGERKIVIPSPLHERTLDEQIKKILSSR